MPAPQNLSSQYMPLNNNSQRSIMSSVTSGLWSVMTLGYGGTSSNSPPYSKNSEEIFTFLPELPQDSNSAGNYNDSPIECNNRLLAWQSCHIILILTNHCTNESLYKNFV